MVFVPWPMTAITFTNSKSPRVIQATPAQKANFAKPAMIPSKTTRLCDDWGAFPYHWSIIG
jgi:hypothetical protein